MEKTIWNKWQRNEKEEATLKLFLLYLFTTREFQSSSRIIQKTEKHHHPIELSSHFEYKKWKEKKNWSSNQFCRPTIIRCHLLPTVSMTVYQKSTVAFTKDLGFNQNVPKNKKILLKIYQLTQAQTVTVCQRLQPDGIITSNRNIV